MTTIGTSEAARRLGVTQRRVVALIKAGRLPAQQIGKTWVIDSAALAPIKVRKPGRPATPRGSRDAAGQVVSAGTSRRPVVWSSELLEGRQELPTLLRGHPGERGGGCKQ
jgi:excisionase family DNA binding protein